MRTMIDIHTHIIPAVDDGAYDIDMSKELLFRAHMQGIAKVFATPHSTAFLDDAEAVREGFETLRDWALKYKLLENMFLGCEIRFETENLRETMKALSAGRFPSLNGTKYVLTEFSFSVKPKDAMEITDLLLREGWIPVIAHAERYWGLYEDDAIRILTEKGALLQVNAVSLNGDMDAALAARARELLHRKQITFLGSDTHRLDYRPVEVEMGLDWLYRNADRSYADAVAFGNAEKMLCG